MSPTSSSEIVGTDQCSCVWGPDAPYPACPHDLRGPPGTPGPTGVSAGHKGVKDAKFSLLPPEFLWGLSRVYGMGAAKYSPRNWERGYDFSSAMDAHDRHYLLWSAREDYDDESKLNHLLHASWMLAALYTFQARGLGIDDRPKGVNIEWLKATLLNPEDIAAARAEQT